MVLAGVVRTNEVRGLALRAASEVPGVLHVQNRLRTDTELTHALRDGLRSNPITAIASIEPDADTRGVLAGPLDKTCVRESASHGRRRSDVRRLKRGLIVQQESHLENDLIRGDLTVLNAHLLLFHPGTFDLALR